MWRLPAIYSSNQYWTDLAAINFFLIGWYVQEEDRPEAVGKTSLQKNHISLSI